MEIATAAAPRLNYKTKKNTIVWCLIFYLIGALISYSLQYRKKSSSLCLSADWYKIINIEIKMVSNVLSFIFKSLGLPFGRF